MASSHPDAESNNGSSVSKEPEKPQYEAFRMPSMEEIRAQEVWNNCAVRSVASGVMGEKSFVFVIYILYLSPFVSWSEGVLLI